ncbi:MAG: elongation factor P [Nitrospinae bacterium]|nr:elongation factor P [Nitrospinota bacterium]
MDITSLRPGLKIETEGSLFVVVSAQHVSPGNKRAFVRARIKNLKTGQLLERTVREGNDYEVADTEEKDMQYLYHDASGYHFMDSQTYDQTFLTEDQVGSDKDFLQENSIVKLLYHNGAVAGMQLPFFVEMAIKETEPGFKGDTASSTGKPAVIETGAVVQVPLFINVGDKIKIDTRTGEYLERV